VQQPSMYSAEKFFTKLLRGLGIVQIAVVGSLRINTGSALMHADQY